VHKNKNSPLRNSIFNHHHFPSLVHPERMREVFQAFSPEEKQVFMEEILNQIAKPHPKEYQESMASACAISILLLSTRFHGVEQVEYRQEISSTMQELLLTGSENQFSDSARKFIIDAIKLKHDYTIRLDIIAEQSDNPNYGPEDAMATLMSWVGREFDFFNILEFYSRNESLSMKLNLVSLVDLIEEYGIRLVQFYDSVLFREHKVLDDEFEEHAHSVKGYQVDGKYFPVSWQM
jgi:hypothetical protein